MFTLASVAAYATPSLAEGHNQFIDAWCGWWSPGPPNRLTVEEVTDEGAASGIYAWGTSPSDSTRFTGKITERTLNIEFFGGGLKISYKLTEDDTLAGTWKKGGRTLTIVSIKCDPSSKTPTLPVVTVGNRAFVGLWCGIWEPGHPNVLLVREVTDDGVTSGIYFWGWGDEKKAFTGRITDGVLRFALPAKLTYRLEENGTLSGTWSGIRGGFSTIRSKRCQPGHWGRQEAEAPNLQTEDDPPSPLD